MGARGKQKSDSRHARTGVLPLNDPRTQDASQGLREAVVTDAELEAWERRVAEQKEGEGAQVGRLIREVRRLREALRGVDQSTTIVSDAERCGGDPILAGTRTAVHDVVSYAHAFGGDLERVRDEALPHLSMKQVRAAMAYYVEHTGEIEEILRCRREEYARLAEAPVRR